MQTSSKAQQTWQGALVLLPAERGMLVVVCGFGVAAVILAQTLGRDVNWPPFLAGFFGTLGLMAIGAYVRGRKDAPRLALALIGVAIFMGFTAVSSVFIFALLPLPNPMIDDWLTTTGHLVGYDWRELLLAMTEYPAALRSLAFVYHSALPQMILVILLLSFHNQPRSLHLFLSVGIISMMIAVLIWWRWPSVGYVGVLQLSDEALVANGLVFGRDHGSYLTNLLMNGPDRISPEIITGVVGFPSYHTIMACMVVWYSRGTKLFPFILLANIAMIPATLLHGGHHIIDLAGGIIVFSVSVMFAQRIIRA